MTGRPAGRGLTDVLPAGLTVLGVQGLEAAAAERAAVLHDVPLPSQGRLTLQAAEVPHVPVATLRFCALVGKNDLRKEGGPWGTENHCGLCQRPSLG